jgi:hypothetical protein
VVGVESATNPGRQRRPLRNLPTTPEGSPGQQADHPDRRRLVNAYGHGLSPLALWLVLDRLLRVISRPDRGPRWVADELVHGAYAAPGHAQPNVSGGAASTSCPRPACLFHVSRVALVVTMIARSHGKVAGRRGAGHGRPGWVCFPGREDRSA